ncbi:MAG: cation:proton antiporter [bacterium]
MLENIFIQITVIAVLATVLGMLAHRFRQPLLLAYIIAGVILGPQLLGMLGQKGIMEDLAKIGIAFLLFLVGLELDFNRLKEIGRTSVALGIGQIVFTAIIGFAILAFLKFSWLAALYMAIALTFSSTIIIVKILSEKNDFQSLYGRISIGMLLVQDFVAILLLALLSSFQTGPNQTASIFLLSLLKGLGLVFLAFLSRRYLLNRLFGRYARSQELLFLISISWCFLFAGIAYATGFSIEIGAFLAGISLSALPYHLEIAGKIRYLRDFFIMLFFVHLGSQLLFTDISSHFWTVVVLSLFVLIGNPFIVMVIMGAMRHRAVTSFPTALTVAQISEFSLILMALGLSIGHVNREEVSIITIVGVITIAGSSYLMYRSQQLYHHLKPFLLLFERSQTNGKEKDHLPVHNHIVVLGHNRLGRPLVKALLEHEYPLVVVDFDPERIKDLREQNIPAVYGDVYDEDVLKEAGIAHAQAVICTVPDYEDNAYVLEYVKRQAPHSTFIGMAYSPKDALDLYTLGADYVIMPHDLGARYLVERLKHHTGGPLGWVPNGGEHRKHVERVYGES